MLKDQVRKGSNAEFQKQNNVMGSGGMPPQGMDPHNSGFGGGQPDGGGRGGFPDPYGNGPHGQEMHGGSQFGHGRGGDDMHGHPPPRGPPGAMGQENEANHILFLSELPRDVQAHQLHMIFANLPGFREIRQVKERGVAFVEYDSP